MLALAVHCYTHGGCTGDHENLPLSAFRCCLVLVVSFLIQRSYPICVLQHGKSSTEFVAHQALLLGWQHCTCCLPGCPPSHAIKTLQGRCCLFFLTRLGVL